MAEEHLNIPASKLPLVEQRTPHDFRSTYQWRVFRIMAEFVDGWQFLADFKKTVTFFGSARLSEDNHWYKEAKKLAGMLAKNDFDIITGGGPGIMEAANCGAHEAHSHHGSLVDGGDSIGLNIKLPFEQRINKYVDKAAAFHYFFVRKVMLMYYGQAYVFFPGGFGTLDEVTEIITLVQTKKVPHIPIVLVGKEFWGGLDSWIRSAMLEEDKTVEKDDLNIYKIVDTAEEAYEIVKHAPVRKEF